VIKSEAKKAVPNEQFALQKLESLFGTDLTKRLIEDNTTKMKSTSSSDPSSSPEPESSASLSSSTPSVLNITAGSEIDTKKRQKLDEYSHLEEKQAKLLKLLNERVYKHSSLAALCDQDEFQRVFYVVAELEPLASMVHEQVAVEMKKRVGLEWTEMPFCGDILEKYYHYYRVYKAILSRYPTCQCTLSGLLKRKPFAAQLKKLLVRHFFILYCRW